ncbi:hypothetical protein BAE44_0023287 [Dichanthelium oligosanthes]|uniref:FAD linked oxidase N-terminal domain-containing protein n=1 Tax=Dichanthelium oligosanthes TaxID=888268 RepID=A0A1E5US92_9POAL|nr:hypothetical protein BAE44_0023287 [Dichanthelium oligosanthes]
MPFFTSARTRSKDGDSQKLIAGAHLHRLLLLRLDPSHASSDDFLQCLSASIPDKLAFAQSSPSFTSVLVSSIENPMFFTPSTVRPLWIVTPTNASQVQAAVICGRRHGVRLRVRSGGHDY